MNEWIKLSEEVKEAKKNGTPIVALESTIISHVLWIWHTV